jgi:hypothetical protein
MKTAIAMFSGTAALAIAVGFGGLGVSPAGGASTTAHVTAPPSSSATPALGKAPASDVHHVVLTSCISGLDC